MITGPGRALLLSFSVPKAACTLGMMRVDPESSPRVCGGLTHPKVLSKSRAGSSESGESSQGSSSHTTNSVAMVDGFALFALAIQDNLRAQLTKLQSGGGEVLDQSLFSELCKLWEEKGEEQKLEWQCQANNVTS
mmetsp:Transcript_104931/g.168977  ORF Transcript_104931/g.168977 Transcript_104931/m.168977 type:complete len:135 (+) Transcript_104931:384-788(+)